MACALVLQIMPGGLLFAAPPCSSYCWLSASRHKRTKRNPLGNQKLKWVRSHNTIACRFSLLVALALARRVHLFVEHPRGSCIHHVPFIKALLSIDSDLLGWRWSETHFYMSAFGAWTVKPSLAISTTPWTPVLALLAGKVTKKVRKAGR